MSKINKFWLLLLLMAALAMTIGINMACDDDDDDDNDDNDEGDDDDTGDDDTSDDDVLDDDDDDNDTGDDDVIEPGKLGGTTKDNKSLALLKGAEVNLVDDESGDLLGVSGFSDPETAYIILDVPTAYELATIGVKVAFEGYMDTYQYHFNIGVTNEDFYGINEDIVEAMALLLPGVSIDDTKGHAAGAVYWGDPTDEEPIGCAMITMDPAQEEIHYMNNLGIPFGGRDDEGTNPLDGKFVALNVDPGGPYTITATVDDDEVSVTLPKVVANSVNIASIYFNKTDFPEKPGCDAE